MRSLRIFQYIVFLFSFAIVISGCTTSTYGQGFQQVQNVENQYSLKIYIGGFSGGAEADKAAEKEIKLFMEKQGFDSYEIVERRHNLVPSYFEYRVKFMRN